MANHQKKNRHAIFDVINLVGSSNADNKDMLWKFINRFHKEIKPKEHQIFDGLTEMQLTILKIKLSQIKI